MSRAKNISVWFWSSREVSFRVGSWSNPNGSRLLPFAIDRAEYLRPHGKCREGVGGQRKR